MASVAQCSINEIHVILSHQPTSGLCLHVLDPVLSILATNGVRLAPNRTSLGLFKISFSTFWHTEPECIEIDLKKYQICPIWGQTDQFGTNPDIYL